jgi:hypothetical protein
VLADSARADLALQIAQPVADSAGAAIVAVPQFLTSQGVPENVANEVTLAAANGFTDGMKATGWTAAFFLLLGLASTYNLGTKSKLVATAAKPRAKAAPKAKPKTKADAE